MLVYGLPSFFFVKVTDEQSLQSCQRLQLCEKCWYKLAMHFGVLLSDNDLQQVQANFCITCVSQCYLFCLTWSLVGISCVIIGMYG